MSKGVSYCVVCGDAKLKRAGALYCSEACRQKAKYERNLKRIADNDTKQKAKIKELTEVIYTLEEQQKAFNKAWIKLHSNEPDSASAIKDYMKQYVPAFYKANCELCDKKLKTFKLLVCPHCLGAFENSGIPATFKPYK